MTKHQSVVHADPDILGGTPVFRGTRVPLRNLVAWTEQFHEGRGDKTLCRLKQWLRTAATVGTFTRFDSVKRAESLEELFAGLEESAVVAASAGG